MFCVLEIINDNKTCIEKFIGKIKKTKYYIRTVPVFKGAPFYVLTVETGRNGVDFNYVGECIGKCAKEILLPENVTLPEKCILSEFESDLLYGIMCRNTFLQIIKEQKDNFDICIVDRCGEYGDFTELISIYAKKLTVVTNRKEKYEAVCERIINETGLCPLVKSEPDNAKVKIDCDRNIMSVKTGNDFMNIGKGEEFTADNVYEKLLPEFVPKIKFFSALYELCGVFSLGNSTFVTIHVNEEKKNIKDIHFT